MTVLNLVYPEQSDVGYKIEPFPDGQNNIVILNGYVHNGVEIVSRFNHFQDLELIIAATKALKRLRVKKVSLTVPYLLGARSDRMFESGGCSYLVDVIAPILNAQDFELVRAFDAHNPDVAAACIKNYAHWNSLSFLQNVYKTDRIGPYSNVVIPDAGAEKRLIPLLRALDHRGQTIQCFKERDLTTGEIKRIRVGDVVDCKGEDVVIIDDLCSRGGTFIAIAKELKLRGAGDIYLVVSHYENTADVNQLKEAGITGVYTTNSICDIESDYIHQFNLFQ